MNDRKQEVERLIAKADDAPKPTLDGNLALQLYRKIERFSKECERAQGTDTGIAWEIFTGIQEELLPVIQAMPPIEVQRIRESWWVKTPGTLGVIPNWTRIEGLRRLASVKKRFAPRTVICTGEVD